MGQGHRFYNLDGPLFGGSFRQLPVPLSTSKAFQRSTRARGFKSLVDVHLLCKLSVASVGVVPGLEGQQRKPKNGLRCCERGGPHSRRKGRTSAGEGP